MRFGLVWLCLADEPLDDILDDAGYLDPVNDIFLAGPFTTRVSAAILADNFLDAAHFPFLHAAHLRRPTTTASRPCAVEPAPAGDCTSYDRQVVDGAHLDRGRGQRAVYEVGVPFSVVAAPRRPDGRRLHLVVRVPADDETSIWYMVHAYPLGGDAR